MKLGPYEIAAPLGAGGMGEIYRARDPRLGREVAIKILPGDWARDPERLQRFEQEARAAGMLNHPNIIAVYDIGTHDGTPYVVTELLDGESLRERLGGDAISPRKAIEIAIQMANGMATAHQAGIVHRDLKPENVFVTRDGRIKILDFGLAKLRAPDSGPLEVSSDTPTVAQHAPIAVDTGPGQVWGTVGYMSPEQVRGKKVDHRSDIFSFGAVLYEMLTGSRAFRGESTADTMSAILREDPPEMASPGHTLPPALERIVRHCLEKNPEERFQSARDLAFDLEALTGLSGSSAAAAAIESGGRWRRFAGAGLIVIGLVAAAGVGAWLGHRGKPPEPDYQQITYRRGIVGNARFTPDGNTVVYSASWDGAQSRIFTARPGQPESRPLDIGDARLASVSPNGELAIYPIGGDKDGRIRRTSAARVSLAGGTPREVLSDVQEVEWAPDGEGFAVVRRSTQNTTLEFPLGNVLVSVFGGIGNVRFSPDGKTIACWVHPQVGDTRGKVVTIPVGGTARDLTPIWSDALGLAWRPDGKEIWFTATREGLDRALYAVDLAGNERLIARIPGSLTLHDIASDGRVLLTRDLMRMQMRGRGPGDADERDLSWYDWTFATSVSNDGSMVFFNESGEGGGAEYAAFMRPMDGGPAVRLGAGSPMSLSPDGSSVLMIGTTPRVLRQVPIGAGVARTIPTGDIALINAIWHPDGQRVFVSGPEPGKGACWYLIEPDKAPRAITDQGAVPQSAAPSPDGRYLAVSLGGSSISIYPVEESGKARTVQMPDSNRVAVPMKWSPDGKSILYVTFPPRIPGSINRIDLDSGRASKVHVLRPPNMTGVADAGGSAVSPDGRYYAYSYTHILSDLYVVSNLE